MFADFDNDVWWVSYVLLFATNNPIACWSVASENLLSERVDTTSIEYDNAKYLVSKYGFRVK